LSKEKIDMNINKKQVFRKNAEPATMPDLDFWDFIMKGGDELLNSEACFNCGELIFMDQEEGVK